MAEKQQWTNCRTRESPVDAPVRLWVRGTASSHAFLWAGALPPPDSGVTAFARPWPAHP